MSENDGRPGDDTGPLDPAAAARGRMSEQDGRTAPREPTLAEKRAREQGARRRAEEERLAEAEAVKKKKRKRVLIGSGAVVGVVALIAVGYAVSSDDEEVQALCTDEATGQVVDESNCVTPTSNAGNTYYGGGGFYPIFIGGGGRQYSYNYGGSGSVGQVATGGSKAEPSSGNIRTQSGKSISRGGLGVSSGSSSSGSSSGSSAGSGSSGSSSGSSKGSSGS